MLVSDPENTEVLSVTSELNEPEPGNEEEEIHAAAQKLTQDFLCQVIQEEEGRSKKTDEEEYLSKEEAERLRQAAPLAAIFRNLPTAASLGLQENHEESGEMPDGETRSTSFRLRVLEGDRLIIMVLFYRGTL